MEDCSPEEVQDRNDRIYTKGAVHNGMDRMSVFGVEYKETKESESLANRVEVMVAHMKIEYQRRNM